MSVEPQSKPAGTRILTILGIIFLILILLCGGLATVAYFNLRTWAVTALQKPILKEIESSNLPADQKARATQTINQLSDDFKSGKIAYAQIAQLGQALAEGPFFNLVMTQGLRATYEVKCTASEDKKRANLLIFDRYQRALVENKITASDAQEDMVPVSRAGKRGDRQIKKDLTEADLNDLLGRMKTKADKANIPNEPFQVDFANELQKAVDKALTGKQTTQPATTEPDTSG